MRTMTTITIIIIDPSSYHPTVLWVNGMAITIRHTHTPDRHHPWSRTPFFCVSFRWVFSAIARDFQVHILYFFHQKACEKGRHPMFHELTKILPNILLYSRLFLTNPSFTVQCFTIRALTDFLWQTQNHQRSPMIHNVSPEICSEKHLQLEVDGIKGIKWWFPQSWGYPNSWMVYFMENTIQKWIIWGYPPFQETSK